MYTMKQRVRYSETDHTKHLTLTGIVNYFQDCSTFQSEDIGVGIEFLEAHKERLGSLFLANCCETLSEDRRVRGNKYMANRISWALWYEKFCVEG